MAFSHDVFHQGTVQNVSYNAAGGASTQSTAFGAQTRYIRVAVQGAITATGGVRISVGDNPTASATTTLLPVNWVEYIATGPGQKIAVLGNDTVTGTVNVTELF